MNFIKFPKITNSYRSKFMDDVKRECGHVGKWYVTEKIHGANFSFWVNEEGQFRFASRNNFVDGSFFDCSEIVNYVRPKIMQMWRDIGANGHALTVYGELFGKGVQKGMPYSTNNKSFSAFMVTVDGNQLPFSTMKDMCANLGIVSVPVVAEYHDLDDAISYDVEALESTYGDGPVEGVVIWPSVPVNLDNGAPVLIKKKTKKFSEQSPKKTKNVAELSGESLTLLSDLLARVSETSVETSLSKFGEFTKDSFGQALRFVTEEVVTDWEEDSGKRFVESVGDDEKIMYKYIQDEIRSILVKYVK